MAGFVQATRVEGAEGRYRAALDPEWFSWGPFGGYLAALALRALGAASRLPWPATFSGLFLAVGKPGPLDVEVVALRRGKRAEALRATLRQDGAPLFEASAWFVDRGLVGLEHEHATMPEIPPPERLRDYRELEDDYDQWDAYWQYLEGRPFTWYLPHERPSRDPLFRGWMRFAEPLAIDSPVTRAATAALWLDLAGWNSLMHAHDWPPTYIAPTLDLTLQFRASLYEDAQAPSWVLIDGVCPTAGAGLAGSASKLWTPGGRLLALSTSQLICRPNPNYAADLEWYERHLGGSSAQ